MATAEFSKIAGILSAYFHSIIFQDLKELNWNSITSTSFVRIFLKVVPRASQVVLVVKNPPANAGDIRHGFDPWVRKIPLRRGMATHSSILAWEIPWTEELGGLLSVGSQRVRHN